MKEDQTLPMRFTKNINITRDLVENYGKTEGCYGCKFAMREIAYAKGHNNECRKRFLEMADQPGYEDLKDRLNKSFERTTRKWLETERQNDDHPSEKCIKTSDSKDQERHESDTEQNKANSTSKQASSSGTKRSASKAVPNNQQNERDEHEATRTREKEQTDMNDLLNLEVCEFYSVPRIAFRAFGKYVSKSASFDINTCNHDGEPSDFTKTSNRQKARKYVNKNKPMFVIGSPPCDQWSIMQNLCNGKRDAECRKRKMIEAAYT